MQLPLARAAAVLALSLAVPAGAQDCLAPDAPAFRVNVANLYWQMDPWLSVDPVSGNIAVGWTTGEDIRLTILDSTGAPVTGDVAVNTTLNGGFQDETTVCFDELGSLLVTWSDRAAYDGEEMGVFGRLYDSSGNAQGPEFQINVEWPASQFRPQAAPLPGGGFVVAFSGRWDGDSFFRILDTNGGFLTGDVQVNTVTNAAQVYPAVCVASDGTIFIAYSESSGFGGVGSGTNIWARTFDSAGNALLPVEFHVADGMAAGDQREPRVAVDAAGRYLVAWEDDTNDGSGWGIFARMYDASLTPLGPVFPVNTTTSGTQRAPEIALHPDGHFVVTWVDFSGGDGQIVARRFGPGGTSPGDEFTVNDVSPGDQNRPSIAFGADGTSLVFAFEGPEIERDVFCRLFTDACEPGSSFCFGVGCPCGNDDPAAGCANSTGSGALLSASGSTSLTADDLVLTATGCPPLNSGLFFTGSIVFDPVFHVGDGFGCTGGNSFRYFPGIVDASGTFVKTNLVSTAPANFFFAGETRHFQAWTRDVLCGPPPAPCVSPCGNNSNLTSAYSVVWTP